jgi:hypothetical protein
LEQLTAAIDGRVLHPFGPDDHAVLQAVNRGEFAIHGLRNRDLQALLYSSAPKTTSEQRRRSAAVSRKLRLLREPPHSKMPFSRPTASLFNNSLPQPKIFAC